MMDKAIQLKSLSVGVNGKRIIQSVSLVLDQGEIGCLLGPSACGKTTLLRAIAGFERPMEGEIWIQGDKVSDPRRLLAVERRRVGMIFQDYALFPHMTVAENILFGMQVTAKKRQQAASRLDTLLSLFELEKSRHAYPHCLSGGQQQRVALARAMAPRPDVLLLDEPFSSLDLELREQLAYQVRVILKREGISALMVSHNQLEAFAIADTIGMIDKGRLLQWDDAFNLYHRPNCVEVARFIGEGVFIPGRVVNQQAVSTELGIINGQLKRDYQIGDRVDVLIRPDDILHDDESPLQARVLNKVFRGAQFLYTLELAEGARVLSLVPSHHDHALNEAIGIRLEIDHLVVF